MQLLQSEFSPCKRRVNILPLLMTWKNRASRYLAISGWRLKCQVWAGETPQCVEQGGEGVGGCLDSDRWTLLTPTLSPPITKCHQMCKPSRGISDARLMRNLPLFHLLARLCQIWNGYKRSGQRAVAQTAGMRNMCVCVCVAYTEAMRSAILHAYAICTSGVGLYYLINSVHDSPLNTLCLLKKTELCRSIFWTKAFA